MKPVMLILLLALTGCSWIESDAGKAHYSYTVTEADGTRHEVVIKNAKNIGLVSAKASRSGDGSLVVELIEQGVDASGPLSSVIEQNSRLIEALTSAVP